MQYSAINIQGNIISGEILEKIRIEDIRYQSQADFGLDKNTTIRDEIGIAWAAARAHWTAFKLRRERLKETDSGTSETRQSWMIPFFRELGYELEKSTAELINGKSYAISHRAANRDGFPVHITGINQSLDKRAETGGTRLSPHALIQEYLNNHEHLFALVTNGQFVRLLRDATRLSRLSYLEFDLERIMEEELFVEFALLYRVLHVTRMPETQDSGEESVIEFYHQEALDSGSRIREKLSEAVEQSLKLLGNGLLQHPANETLHEEALSAQLQPGNFYLHLLRVVYRTLFLMVTEERHLIYPEKRDEETNRKRDIYYRYYSIGRLTRMAEKQIYVDPCKIDLWRSLLVTFRLFENEKYGEKLAIKPLGSGLFAPNALGSLKDQELDNRTLLDVLNLLVTFENENRQRVRVNYADLDVEEFGSVYEGLLEYDPVINSVNGKPVFSFVKGEGRSSSGSHYTPEELVKPLIKHSLDYIIEERLNVPEHVIASEVRQTLREQQLLSISVADVACGSGHILLSAARRIALELARVRTGEDQPAPPAMRKATRDVIRNCIYGVDLNPLAVELCKVALWLEAHNPGEPLNFLDHRIKCGNSIVGVAHMEDLKKGIPDEAFKKLADDDKETVKYFRDKNKEERKELAGQFKIDRDADVNNRVEELAVSYGEIAKMPEFTPEEIEAKKNAYNKLTYGYGWMRLQQLADIQTAQFYIPKTENYQSHLITDGDYRTWLNGKQQITGQAPAYAGGIAARTRFFHWFLQFPTVMQNGGFDCIVGNPPFLGGQKLTGIFGNNFAEYVKYEYAPIGSVDLVTYFFRRIFNILKRKGFLSLISTNTIAQGDARVGGLAVIYQQGGAINHAVRSMKWPGRAAVEVSLVTIHKGKWNGKYILDQKEVRQVTSYLDDSIPLGDPFPLKANEEKSFQGSIVLGKGFVLTPIEAQKLIDKNKKNKDVLFPYLNGDDLNNQVDQSPTRWVINFKDWPLCRYTQEEWDTLNIELQNEIEKKLEKGNIIEIAPPHFKKEVAADYPDCLDIVERLVKPERLKQIGDRGAQFWWQFLRMRGELYSSIENLKKVIAVARISKTVAFELIPKRMVFADALVIFPFDNLKILCLLQSTLNVSWAWNYCTTMKSDLNYSPGNTFDTLPFPYLKKEYIENTGKIYFEHRQGLMKSLQAGLTKTYNLFHATGINEQLKSKDLNGKTNKEIKKKYGKEIWNLWKHLQKMEYPNKGGTSCTWEDAVKGIEELRRLHVDMDNAVLEAYGWHEDSEKWGKAIALKHDFYEVDYLPENDRVRFTIHPNARKEVLKRLLLLNHERYEDEIKQGLHKKKDVEKFYAQKGQAVPAGVVFSDAKSNAKTKTSKQREKAAQKIYGQHNLFGEAAEPDPKKVVTKTEPVIDSSLRKIEWHHSMKSFKVIITNSNGHEFRYHVFPAAQRGKFTKNYKQISPNSPMALNIIGKQEGDTFEFGGMEYRIERIEI